MHPIAQFLPLLTTLALALPSPQSNTWCAVDAPNCPAGSTCANLGGSYGICVAQSSKRDPTPEPQGYGTWCAVAAPNCAAGFVCHDFGGPYGICVGAEKKREALPQGGFGDPCEMANPVCNTDLICDSPTGGPEGICV